MVEYFSDVKPFLLVFVILLANIHENDAYDPPAATVEPLYPTGLRLSVPGKMTKACFNLYKNF